MTRAQLSETSRTQHLRVLQFVNTLARTDGGPARNAYELHRALNRVADCTAAMFAVHRVPSGETVATDEELASGALNGGQIVHPTSALRFLKLLREADAVVIHGYYLIWAPFIAATARMAHTSVFLTPHGSLTNYQRNMSRFKKMLFDQSVGRLLRLSVDSYMVGSKAEAKEMYDVAKSTPVVVVGVGAPITTMGEVARQHKLIESKQVELLSISRIAPKKRIDLMIDAVAVLEHKGFPAVLTIAGTGPDRLVDELRAKALTLGIADNVHFVGEVNSNEKELLYRRADIFLAPSDDENFGISVAESLGQGLACVASAHVASASGLKPPAGIVVSDRSGDGLAHAVVRLMHIPPDARASASRSFAQERFDWQSVASRWIRAMRDAAK